MTPPRSQTCSWLLPGCSQCCQDRQEACLSTATDREPCKQGSGKVLPAFPTPDYSSDMEPDTREMVRAQNKKKKKSGGFQSMGLSYPVFKGIMKKGYKVPTPIQRRTIPVILDGKDMVAMARTGSGKTACFLIPMFEKLKAHSAQTGARALILSPTRELALQTMKFTKELGKFTGLKTALILGGERMEDQFAALHENPDIIIGTPGRLMHVAVEMNLKLRSVEYVVFDEADRLFEMGFAEQLQEIIARLPETRQTLLFSATLPKLLVEFARAGLTEPVLIRLDVETKLSEQLKLLTAQGVNCTHIYSSLDQAARKINIAKFVHGQCAVLIVTDVAARGIDIPMLDNVINYSFPAKPKLFLHRVGRVARAGRSGTAYSLVASDETPYVFDLHLFLGRPLTLASPHEKPSDRDGVFGRVPQSVIDDEECLLLTDHEGSLDLQSLRKVSENAHKQYLKSRPGPSPESVKRVKELDFSLLGIHPLFSSCFGEDELERLKFVDSIKTYRSKATIFEINATNKTLASDVMRAKRSRDRSLINKYQRGQQERRAEAALGNQDPAVPAPEEEEANLQEVFSAVVGRKRKQHQVGEGIRKKQRHEAQRDEELYIPYRPKDLESERGLSIGGEGSAFEQQASGAMLDLLGDETHNMSKTKQLLKWDRKKKRFVGKTGQEDKKKICTESGRYISGSYKNNLYEKWKKKYKVEEWDSEEEARSEPRGGTHRRARRDKRLAPSPGKHSSQPGKVHSELKNKQQILKQRKRVAKQNFLQKGGLKRLKGKKRQRVQELRRMAFGRGAAKKGQMRKRM
ncbi:ATP-dependent RNA helicase DDX54 isoform X4 [Gopherus evgoodei]|uniref:ATP-dependent RNA helicase DDX54 isoform X4 n=1 Tax=Gopherus evgoodei TaxID=1825980 RepID=UPI0011CF5F1F|nr:ATP-dependent RNA helicase DDX54 isoform X4 [Gopherus evgoodei]